MAEKILVPLKKHDRVEEFIPYIQKVTELDTGWRGFSMAPVSPYSSAPAFAPCC